MALTPTPGGPGSSDANTPSRTSEVIPLSRWRAALARARRGRRVDEIVQLPDAEKQVRRMPAQEVYHLVKQTGLVDSIELLALASSAQLRALLDLDCWSRDELSTEKAHEWIGVLAEAGPEHVVRLLETIDAEVGALLVQRHAQIYDTSLGEAPPDETEGTLMSTPDRTYVIELEPGEVGNQVGALLDLLYRTDRDLARRLLVTARWELGTDLEEHAYRWRTGRLADLGYPDYYEALEVYAPLDISLVKIGEGTAERDEGLDPPAPLDDEVILPTTENAPDGTATVAGVPGFFVTPLERDTLLTRALARLRSEDEVARIGRALVYLTNRVMSADRIEPGDLEAAQTVLERVRDTLDLGLDLLARGDAQRGAEALLSVALSRIFRVGHALLSRLSRLADALVKGRLTLTPVVAGEAPSLLESPARELVEGLRRRRPVIFCGLDDPPTAGFRQARSLADVERAALALERAALLGEIAVSVLRFEPEGLARLHVELGDSLPPEIRASGLLGPTLLPPASEIRIGHLYATAAANLALGRKPSAGPLTATDLTTLVNKVFVDGPDAKLRPEIGDLLREHIRRELEAQGRPYPAVVAAFVDEVMARLGEELGGLRGAAAKGPLDARFVGALLVSLG